MANPHDLLRRLLAGKGHADGEFHWHHVLRLMQEVRASRSADSDALLQEIAEYEGHLVFDGRHGHPHAMPPSDVLRTLAVQILAERNVKLHRKTIERAADIAQSHAARAIAREVLG
ncbi:MAG: hypothetical protein ACRENB_16695 [Gemmatimonadales bacterium]